MKRCGEFTAFQMFDATLTAKVASDIWNADVSCFLFVSFTNGVSQGEFKVTERAITMAEFKEKLANNQVKNNMSNLSYLPHHYF